jgi:hypothetical protein
VQLTANRASASYGKVLQLQESSAVISYRTAPQAALIWIDHYLGSAVCGDHRLTRVAE